jgi:hypothetical protein
MAGISPFEGSSFSDLVICLSRLEAEINVSRVVSGIACGFQDRVRIPLLINSKIPNTLLVRGTNVWGKRAR